MKEGRVADREKGQVIPIAALMMIVIIGFAAVIIDGGRGYVDRRDLQAAADTAALSGAGHLGAHLGTSFDLSCAVAAAVNQAVQNLPGTTSPPTYAYGAGGSCPSLSNATFQYSASGINLGNSYTMDIAATVAQVKVTLHQSLALTFGVAAGFGPSFTPGATATAVNGGLPFAFVLFRNNQDGSAKTANLTFAGNTTGLCIVPKGTACTAGPYSPGTWGGIRANALTDESLCPQQGTVDFRGTGDMYAFQAPNFPSNCSGGASGVLNTFSGSAESSFPVQIGDPSYPKPGASSAPPGQSNCTYPATGNPTCTISISRSTAVECLMPGIYDTIDVKKGTVVLLPGIYEIADSAGLNNSGLKIANGTSVITADLVTAAQLADSGTVGCSSLGGAPAASGNASGVIVEMTPQGDGSYNQVSVAQGTLKLHSAPKYSNISIYVEHGDPCVYNSGQGCGSSVINFSSPGATYSVLGLIYGYGDNMKFAGGSGGQGIGQAFAWTVFVNGGGTLAQTYDPGSIPFLQGLLN